MKIYQILENLYYGGEIEVPDGQQGIPLYTTRTAPPAIPDGMFGRWNGTGWDIIDVPPPIESTPTPEPVIENPTDSTPEPVIENPTDPTPEPVIENPTDPTPEPVIENPTDPGV